MIQRGKDRPSTSSETIESPDRLLELSGELARLEPSHPMLSAAWMSQWWRHYGQTGRGAMKDSRLLVLAVRGRDDELIGLAPWYLDRCKVIRFLGTGTVCSDHLSILCRPGWEAAVAPAVVQWLFQECAGRQSWRAIELEAVDADDAFMELFVHHLKAQDDALVSCRAETSSWCLELPPTWEGYLDQLSKNRRKRCRRWQRSFFESQRARLRVFETADQLSEGFEILARLHNRRRRAVGQEGVFEDAAFQAFHRAVANDLVDAGSLRLNCLELDGRPIAAEYGFADRTTVYAYQSGVEPAALQHGPGNLSVMANIRSAITQGYGAFDFLRGDESYKSCWGAKQKRARRVLAWHRTLAGRVKQMTESARQQAKPVVGKLARWRFSNSPERGS